jgi:ornithine--oxo-acid transaminase
LVITEEEIQKALAIINEAVNELPTLKGKTEAQVIPSEEKDVKIGIEN